MISRIKGLARAGGAYQGEELSLFDVEVDARKVERRQHQVEILYGDHDLTLALAEIIRRITKRSKDTTMSHTATGWEYFRP